jgi:hypothetical protein
MELNGSDREASVLRPGGGVFQSMPAAYHITPKMAGFSDFP